MGKQNWKPGNMLNPVPAVMVSVTDKAGNNNIIDAIEIYYYTPNNIRPYKKARYKVNGYPYQYDNERKNGMDGYAGVIGVPVTTLQIKVD